MTAKGLQRAIDHACGLDQKLRSDDSRLRGSTLVFHEDGSIFFIDSSFLVEWKDPEHVSSSRNAARRDGAYLIILAEHHEPHVFPFDDVLIYRSFQRT